MIEDENDPEYKRVVKALFEQVTVLANMRGFSEETIRNIEELCADARRKSAARGVALPEMVVLYMPAQLLIKIYRRDATGKMIKVYIVNLMQELQVQRISFTPKDVADAFSRAFPHYKPDPTPPNRAARRRMNGVIDESDR